MNDGPNFFFSKAAIQSCRDNDRQPQQFKIQAVFSVYIAAQDGVEVVKNSPSLLGFLDQGHAFMAKQVDLVFAAMMTCLQMKEPGVRIPLFEEEDSDRCLAIVRLNESRPRVFHLSSFHKVISSSKSCR
jgi:hypothetical protein